MPRLSELTDAYYDPTPAELPVEKPFVDLKKVYIETPKEEVKLPSSNIIEKLIKTLAETQFSKGGEGFNNVFGLDDKPRYQLWPEKVFREGITGAGDVLSGKTPQWAVDPATGDVHTSPQMVEKAQAISALAGTGGLGGVTDATLGATPFLRPALKYKDKLYKGKEGQQHLDVIPENLYTDFQKKAMSGEDIAEYNFGFINDKGHFLDREKALKYGIDTGIIDPQAGKFGALTSTLMADSSKPGVAIEAAKTAQPFYSALEHNVGQISQSKMTGDQWLGTLSNKPGVKPEEMQWTGLADFLAENKGKPVTKAQIEEHLAANKIELKEVTKGELTDQDILKQSKIRQEDWDKMSQSQKEVIRTNFPTNPTKYHSYQLPGGENYREMLLTLPRKEITTNDVSQKLFKRNMQNLDESERQAVSDEMRRLHEAKAGGTDYRSSHWDEPNILAHVRMNDRTIDGKKSLHLEEIQSDWHQQGRDKGYSNKDELAKKYFEKPYKDLDKTDQNFVNEKSTSGVPDAPFKKSWHELALKRMLREAAEKGYDRLSWTPGEAQAARYDLSKQVDNVSYLFNKDKTKVTLNAGKNNGEHVFSQNNVPVEKVSDFVGKELADKIKNDAGKLDHDTGYKVLSGVDLKIGGEGMKGFYDQIIPKSLEKLGKEHGVKVKKDFVANKEKEWPFSIRVASDGKKYWLEGKDPRLDHSREVSLSKKFDSFADADVMRERFYKGETEPVYYIDIPQSLKNTAMHKGFPLFAKGGYMLQPVDFDPFESKQ